MNKISIETGFCHCHDASDLLPCSWKRRPLSGTVGPYLPVARKRRFEKADLAVRNTSAFHPHPRFRSKTSKDSHGVKLRASSIRGIEPPGKPIAVGTIRETADEGRILRIGPESPTNPLKTRMGRCYAGTWFRCVPFSSLRAEPRDEERRGQP